MKAVGATNRDVLSVFLGEASGIGFIGGLGGVLVGWSAAQLINVVALAYMARQSAQTGAPPTSVAAFTPLWLPAFTLIFATLNRSDIRALSSITCRHDDPGERVKKRIELYKGIERASFSHKPAT